MATISAFVATLSMGYDSPRETYRIESRGPEGRGHADDEKPARTSYSNAGQRGERQNHRRRFESSAGGEDST